MWEELHVLKLEQVSQTLGERQWHLDIELDSHGVYALMGRSGSGKSTLLNIIAGFMAPDAGDVSWSGQSLLTLEPADRPITTLFQSNNLFSHLSVLQNIGLGIRADLKLDKDARDMITDVLSDVGLQGFEAKHPGQLSGGEQQRVALARCLLRKQPVLLLDEPFSALDATTRQEMVDLLQALIQRFSPCVIMVTHDLADVDAMKARELRMQDGRLSLR